MLESILRQSSLHLSWHWLSPDTTHTLYCVGTLLALHWSTSYCNRLCLDWDRGQCLRGQDCVYVDMSTWTNVSVDNLMTLDHSFKFIHFLHIRFSRFFSTSQVSQDNKDRCSTRQNVHKTFFYTVRVFRKWSTVVHKWSTVVHKAQDSFIRTLC